MANLKYASIQQGSTIDSLKYRNLKENGKPRDLTGATNLLFRMVAEGGAVKVSATATAPTPTDGTLQYVFQADDVNTPGAYKVQWEFVLNTLKHVSPPIDFEILANP